MFDTALLIFGFICVGVGVAALMWVAQQLYVVIRYRQKTPVKLPVTETFQPVLRRESRETRSETPAFNSNGRSHSGNHTLNRQIID